MRSGDGSHHTLAVDGSVSDALGVAADAGKGVADVDLGRCHKQRRTAGSAQQYVWARGGVKWWVIYEQTLVSHLAHTCLASSSVVTFATRPADACQSTER